MLARIDTPSMFTTVRSLVLGLALALPSAAFAQPSDDPATDPLDDLLMLRVEMDGGEEIAAQLRPEILTSLREAEVPTQLPESAPLEVTISLDPDQPGAYRVLYTHQGKPIDSWSCTCSGDELLSRLRATAIQAWTTTLDAAAAETTTEPVPPPPTEPTTERVDEQRASARALWIAGMATVVGGVGVTGGGVVWLISDAGGDEGISPAALGVLGAGVALSATGAALWGVGRKRLNRLNRLQPQVGMLGPRRGRGVFIAVQGRF